MNWRITIFTIATLLTTQPAWAQEVCSGLGAGGQWIGGTEAASDIAMAAAAEQQMVLVLPESQYVSLFNLTAPAEVRIEAEAVGAGDPLVYLFSADGAIVGNDDDSGGNGAARLEITLQPGAYCVAVQSFGGAPMSGYLQIGRTEHEAMTAGADSIPEDDYAPDAMPAGFCSEAPMTGYFADGPIDDALGGGISGSASAADLAFWRFTLAAPQALTITATNLDADPFITLYDAQDVWIAENDDFDGLNSQIDMVTPLAAGDYCIGVQALSDPSLPITLTLTAYDPEAARLATYDRAEAVPPLDGSYPVTDLGEISARTRQDAMPDGKAAWFKIEVEQGGLLLVEAIAGSDGGDPTLVIFDDLGRKIVENDDYGGYNSMAVARVIPGTYLIAVKHLDASQSGLIRLLIERYAPVN